MYHKSDHVLNRQIRELSRIKISLSGKKVIAAAVIYMLLTPFVVSMSIRLDNAWFLYLYLVPFLPVIGITYLIFTGKIKWLIKLLHRISRIT